MQQVGAGRLSGIRFVFQSGLTLEGVWPGFCLSGMRQRELLRPEIVVWVRTAAGAFPGVAFLPAPGDLLLLLPWAFVSSVYLLSQIHPSWEWTFTLGNTRQHKTFSCNKQAQSKLAFQCEAMSPPDLAGFPVCRTGQPRYPQRDLCFPRKTTEQKQQQPPSPPPHTQTHRPPVIRTEVERPIAGLCKRSANLSSPGGDSM